MLLRIALFAMLGLGIAGVGAVGWFMLPSPPPETQAAAPPATVSVLVAATALRAGNLIKPGDLRAMDMPRSDAPAGATLDTPQGRGGLTGTMIRRTLGENELILPADVVRPGDHGFLAAVLKPGTRAVSVAVDAVSGTAGLIWPGDRVDVVLTQTVDDPALTAGHNVAAQTVLSDARVIAIDQQLVQGQAPEGVAPPANRTATLEVTAAQVERVLVAAKLGRLSLSVLAAERGEADPLPPSAGLAANHPAHAVTWASDVSPVSASAESRPAPVMVRVFQGDGEGKEFHF